MKTTSVCLLLLGCIVAAEGCQSNRSEPTTRPMGAIAPTTSTKQVDTDKPAMIHFNQNDRQ